MAKKKYDPSWFMNEEMIEELKKLGENPSIEDFTNGVMDIFKTPILLRTLASAIEQDNKPVIELLAKEINFRIFQILNDQSSRNNTLKN